MNKQIENIKAINDAWLNINVDDSKIINPFSMVLPPGYSVLFCPLINRPEPRFTVLSGIVDEGYDLPTNFPIVLRKKGTWLLKKGEPIVGVIPFKRESWKMWSGFYIEKLHSKTLNLLNSEWVDRYKNRFWNKKSFK